MSMLVQGVNYQTTIKNKDGNMFRQFRWTFYWFIRSHRAWFNTKWNIKRWAVIGRPINMEKKQIIYLKQKLRPNYLKKYVYNCRPYEKLPHNAFKQIGYQIDPIRIYTSILEQQRLCSTSIACAARLRIRSIFPDDIQQWSHRDLYECLDRQFL